MNQPVRTLARALKVGHGKRGEQYRVQGFLADGRSRLSGFDDGECHTGGYLLLEYAAGTSQ